MLRKLAVRGLRSQVLGYERTLVTLCPLKSEKYCKLVKISRCFISKSCPYSVPGRHHDPRSLGPTSGPILVSAKSGLPVILTRRRFYNPSLALRSAHTEKPSLEGDFINSESEMASRKEEVTLENITFDNKALKDLPVDSSVDPRIRRQVQGACFASAHQEPLENPETVAVSPAALDLIDISESEALKDDFPNYFSGSKPFPGSTPAAHCYCGHQFGYFSGQLGDGAAMYIGEVINRAGERWELQLKGSGPTPFSRQADGRKVLRSSIREFLCSEAMHFLGIPTTRSATCITSDTKVLRDIFYDGNPIMERATVISRIAPTFLRFGSFEIFKPTDVMTGRKGPSVGNKELLHKMLQYTITSFFPETIELFPDAGPNQYADFYKRVVLKTAWLVAQWQAVGFCHGVLNTDNMSILGLTIDYGPFGFMDYFNPDHICNASDDQGRYSYKNQPSICKWNLRKFAEALQDALPLETSLEILKLYDLEFKTAYNKKMQLKLGLIRKSLDSDRTLVSSLFDTMETTSSDFTNSFRLLSEITPEEEDAMREEEILSSIVSQCQSIEGLKKAYRTNSDPQQVHLLLNMVRTQPALLQQLGDGAVMQLQKELERIEKLKELSRVTGEEKLENDRAAWRKWILMYRERLQREFEDLEEISEKEEAMRKRKQTMNENNPAVVLRNYLAQHVIEAAEDGSFVQVNHLLKVLQNPYNEAVPAKDSHIYNSMLCDSDSEVKEKDDFPHGHSSVPASNLKKNVNYQSKVPVSACNIRIS